MKISGFGRFWQNSFAAGLERTFDTKVLLVVIQL
jgi:hypothetical protein